MNESRLNILYRGSLSSCNYGCSYCPFALKRNSAAELAKDRAELERFVHRIVAERVFGERPLGIFFTPWGEALTRDYYHASILELAESETIVRIAVQTNLSANLNWLQKARREKIALWASYHPDQVSRERFLGRCRELDELGVRYSVGMVGLKENLDEIEAMRAALDERVYLWVNAYKREENYYSDSMLMRIRSIDSLFDYNLTNHQSLGRACKAGESVVSIDGEGTIRRCHFIQDKLGNLHDEEPLRFLRRRPCTNDVCRCHIGYVHLEKTNLYPVFGEGLLERIPAVIPPRN